MFSCIYMYVCDMLVEYKWSRINVSFGWVFDDRNLSCWSTVLHDVDKLDIWWEQVFIKLLRMRSNSGHFMCILHVPVSAFHKNFLFQNSRIKGILKFIFDISYKYELYSMSATSNIEI